MGLHSREARRAKPLPIDTRAPEARANMADVLLVPRGANERYLLRYLLTLLYLALTVSCLT